MVKCIAVLMKATRLRQTYFLPPHSCRKLVASPVCAVLTLPIILGLEPKVSSYAQDKKGSFLRPDSNTLATHHHTPTPIHIYVTRCSTILTVAPNPNSIDSNHESIEIKDNAITFSAKAHFIPDFLCSDTCSRNMAPSLSHEV